MGQGSWGYRREVQTYRRAPPVVHRAAFCPPACSPAHLPAYLPSILHARCLLTRLIPPKPANQITIRACPPRAGQAPGVCPPRAGQAPGVCPPRAGQAPGVCPPRAGQAPRVCPPRAGQAHGVGRAGSRGLDTQGRAGQAPEVWTPRAGQGSLTGSGHLRSRPEPQQNPGRIQAGSRQESDRIQDPGN